jgi:ABC-type branched-subunit amino acid transport system substrate-binding protein
VALIATACGSSTHSAGASSTSPSATQAAPASGQQIGLTATNIKVAVIADESGPIPGLFQSAIYGMQAWGAYVNANGGIDGRQVTIDVKDSALDCNTYKNELAQAEASDFATVGGYSVVDTCGKGTLTTHPDFTDLAGTVIDPTLLALPDVFSAYPTPPGYATTGYAYLKAQYPDAVTHTAALYQAAVQTIFNEESNAAESIGYKYVYHRALGTTETNFTSDILRMKSDGARIVDMPGTSLTAVVDFLQQAAQQNFRPVAVIGSQSTYDPRFFTDIGATNAGNLVMALPYAPYLEPDTSVPMLQTFLDSYAKTHPGSQTNSFGLNAFAAGLYFEQAMKAMGSDPTRTGLQTQLAAVKSFDADGLLAAADVGAKTPSPCVVIIGVKGKAFARLTPSSGYDCNGTFVPYKPTNSP